MSWAAEKNNSDEEKEYGKIVVAINEKKANELFTTIGYQLSKTTSAICFDSNISYTAVNVKYT